MRQSFIPMRFEFQSKKGATTRIHNVIYLWSECWGEADDWYFVWERNAFKPYYRREAYDPITHEKINPHYHYITEEDFRKQLDEFLNELPLIPVIVNKQHAYLVMDFGNEIWAYSLKLGEIIVTSGNIKPGAVGASKDVVKKALADFVMNGIKNRLEFANVHTHHLIVITRKKAM